VRAQPPQSLFEPNAWRSGVVGSSRLVAHAHITIATEPDNVVVKSTTIGTCQNFRVALYKVRSIVTIILGCFSYSLGS
jgi:hypothetical protein